MFPAASLLAAGLYWEWIVRLGRAHGRQLGGRYIEVRYEDLVERPESALKTIGEFLHHELDYTHIQETSVGSVKKPLTSFKEDLREGQFTPVGRWKEKFPAEQLTQFEQLIGRYLQELGYTLSDPENASADSFALRKMRWTYRNFYEFKQWAKVNTPLSRWMVSYSDILIDK